MNPTGYIIRIYGESCNYYVASAIGSTTTRLSEAHAFDTERDARNVAVELWGDQKIGHWEIKAAPPKFFPSCT